MNVLYIKKFEDESKLIHILKRPDISVYFLSKPDNSKVYILYICMKEQRVGILDKCDLNNALMHYLSNNDRYHLEEKTDMYPIIDSMNDTSIVSEYMYHYQVYAEMFNFFDDTGFYVRVFGSTNKKDIYYGYKHKEDYHTSVRCINSILFDILFNRDIVFNKIDLLHHTTVYKRINDMNRMCLKVYNLESKVYIFGISTVSNNFAVDRWFIYDVAKDIVYNKRVMSSKETGIHESYGKTDSSDLIRSIIYNIESANTAAVPTGEKPSREYDTSYYFDKYKVTSYRRYIVAEFDSSIQFCNIHTYDSEVYIRACGRYPWKDTELTDIYFKVDNAVRVIPTKDLATSVIDILMHIDDDTEESDFYKRIQKGFIDTINPKE